MTITTGALRGAAAGAAGATALNALTYLDMTLRGRPASSTPEETVQTLSRQHLPIPGGDETRGHRVAGLGGLLGLTAGVGVGTALGVARSLGWRPRPLVHVLAATGAALLVGNVPMTGLGVTDPRAWSVGDWGSDLVPHLGYGIVAAAVLQDLDP